jgi:hypothetical protein
MDLPQSDQLQDALWENTARLARTEAIPTLSRILRITISSDAFTGRAEFTKHMHACRGIELREQRFPVDKQREVLSVLGKIAGLDTPEEALLFFGRSSRIGGLRVSHTPSAETLLSLLDWDQDDVFVFDKSDKLVVHVDRGEDWLKPADMGIASREMLYIVSAPT